MRGERVHRLLSVSPPRVGATHAAVVGGRPLASRKGRNVGLDTSSRPHIEDDGRDPSKGVGSGWERNGGNGGDASASSSAAAAVWRVAVVVRSPLPSPFSASSSTTMVVVCNGAAKGETKAAVGEEDGGGGGTLRWSPCGERFSSSRSCTPFPTAIPISFSFWSFFSFFAFLSLWWSVPSGNDGEEEPKCGAPPEGGEAGRGGGTCGGE